MSLLIPFCIVTTGVFKLKNQAFQAKLELKASFFSGHSVVFSSFINSLILSLKSSNCELEHIPNCVCFHLEFHNLQVQTANGSANLILTKNHFIVSKLRFFYLTFYLKLLHTDGSTQDLTF